MRTLFLASTPLTSLSFHMLTIPQSPRAHAFKTCTGSSGSSHQPLISPVCADLGVLLPMRLDNEPPSENDFFQFVEGRSASSPDLDTLTVGPELDAPGEMGEVAGLW